MKTWDKDSLGYYERKQCELWLHAAHTKFLIEETKVLYNAQESESN